MIREDAIEVLKSKGMSQEEAEQFVEATRKEVIGWLENIGIWGQVPHVIFDEHGEHGGYKTMWCIEEADWNSLKKAL